MCFVSFLYDVWPFGGPIHPGETVFPELANEQLTREAAVHEKTNQSWIQIPSHDLCLTFTLHLILKSGTTAKEKNQLSKHLLKALLKYTPSIPSKPDYPTKYKFSALFTQTRSNTYF